jgi:hypothetical protein
MPNCEHRGTAFYAGDGAWADSDYLCAACIRQHLTETLQETPVSAGLQAKPNVPKKTVTYRIRGLDRARCVAEGLISHGQWLTFGRCVVDKRWAMEYEFILDAATRSRATTSSPRVISPSLPPAAGLFAGKVRIDYERHGTPLYVVVWQSGRSTGFVVTSSSASSTGIAVAELPVAAIEAFEAKSCASPDELA